MLIIADDKKGVVLKNRHKKAFEQISLEMIYRGLYHFNVAYNKGKATDPIQYFSDPNNQDLGIVKRKRKPNIKLIVAPFPDRQRGQDNFFLERRAASATNQNPLTPCSSA